MLKLTNKEEEIMHILWKLKSVRKELMAEITEEQPHYNTCRPSCVTLSKRIRCITPTGKPINTIPSLPSRTTEKGLWIWQLTIISTVHTKMVSFCQRENISQRASRNSGHDRKSEKKKNRLSPEITIVYLKIKRWKHYLFTS
jgi:hypothetical protein